MQSLFSPTKHEKGQGLVEYALILVLVAIVVIAALMILGPIIGNVFSQINSSLSMVSTGGIEEVVAPPPPPDCSAEQAAFNAALNAYNDCMAAHHNEAHECQAEQNAVDSANLALEACTLP